MKRFNILERSIVFILLMNLITQFTLWVVGGGGSGFKMMSSRTMPVDFYMFLSSRGKLKLELYDFGELMIFGIVPIFVFLIYSFVFKMKPNPKD